VLDEMERAAALRQGVFVKPVAEALGNSVDVQPSASLGNSIAPQFSRATRPASMRTTVSDGSIPEFLRTPIPSDFVRGAPMDVGTKQLVAFPGDDGDSSVSIDRCRY